MSPNSEAEGEGTRTRNRFTTMEEGAADEGDARAGALLGAVSTKDAILFSRAGGCGGWRRRREGGRG